MTDPLFSGWPIEIDGRFPNQLVLGETPPRPKKLPPPPTFIEISPGNLRLLPRPSLDLQFWATKSLVDATTGANLIDFTRASSGTYVGSDGLIKTATTNLLLQSEDFSTTWSSDGVCTVDTNQTLSPVGTLTADKITVNAGALNRVSQTPAIAVVAGRTYIFSAYVKTLDINQIAIRLFLSGSDAYVDYNFANNSFSVVNPSVLTQTGYTSLSDGWTRVFAKYQPTVNGSVNIRIGGGFGVTSANGSFYLWGAQLEQSSTVGEYIKTTSTINSAPRFDHDPTTGESLGLLVEESRANLLLRSEEFENAYWTKNNACTITANDIASPSGTLTADRFNGAALTSSGVYVFPATASGQAYTFSVYIKNSLAATAIRLGFESNPSNAFVTFNAVTGTITSAAANVTSSSVQSVGDGWHRVAVSCVATGASAGMVIYSMTGAAATWYLWGAQLEAGSFPTSYIPTTTSAVTRAADVASISGSNFSSWYNASEGTVLWKGIRATRGGFPDRFRFSDGTLANRYFAYWDAAVNSSTFEVIANSTQQAAVYGGQGALNTSITAAYGIAANNASVVYDGVVRATDTSVTVPAVNELRLGQGLTGHISRFTFWPQRLPNETLQTITQ